MLTSVDDKLLIYPSRKASCRFYFIAILTTIYYFIALILLLFLLFSSLEILHCVLWHRAKFESQNAFCLLWYIDDFECIHSSCWLWQCNALHTRNMPWKNTKNLALKRIKIINLHKIFYKNKAFKMLFNMEILTTRHQLHWISVRNGTGSQFFVPYPVQDMRLYRQYDKLLIYPSWTHPEGFLFIAIFRIISHFISLKLYYFCALKCIASGGLIMTIG